MMSSQPSPPPPASGPLSAEAVARVDAENAALAAQIANRELRREAGAQPAVGVVKGADGVITVTGRDGQTVRIDPRAVTDPDDVREMVQTALAPPPAPERGDPRTPVAVVAIVFTFLFLVVLTIARTVQARARAAAAPRGDAPELSARLARIEQAIEAVAIEVERIAESERYSARLLTERLPDPLAAGANQAVTAESRRGG